MPARRDFIRWCVFILSMSPAAIVAAADAPVTGLSGTVQDRGGTPIAGVSVSLINATDVWEATSDDAGAFHLDNVPSEGTVLLMEHDDFRFHGEPLSQSDQPIVRQLARVSETAGQGMVGEDWLISPDQRMKLVHRAFDPFLKQMLAGEEDRDKLLALEVLALIDPEQALEICEEGKTFKKPDMRMAVRAKVMERFAAEDPDAAIEVAESFNNAYMRAFAFLKIVRLTPEMAKPDRIELLSRAAADARSVKNPGARIALMGLVGESLLDAGEKATAEKILRKTQQAAEKVAGAAWAGFARGAFAEGLAQIDIAAALPLVTELSDEDSKMRHLGNIAHELAAIDPAQAERVLNLIERPKDSQLVIHERDQYAVRVCYRMAKVDLVRAKRIADSCHETNQRAYAYGLIAHAIADHDREAATELLRHAYELLKAGVRDPTVVKIHASQIAGCLLPAAERIDPSLVPEMLWRTIALRTPRSSSQQHVTWSDQQTSQLAAWLSRYDRGAARFILDHWHSGDEMPYGRYQYTFALALVDPQRAVEFAESKDDDQTLRATRLTVAKTLLAEGETRIQIPHREAGLWPIDLEEEDW